MKEDILEQVVDDYLQHQGYFTTHNVKFKPDPAHPDYVKNADSVHSDIDVLGYHPLKQGVDKVLAVSCKSWQGGFNATYWAAKTMHGDMVSKKETWKRFREISKPKWALACREKIKALTGCGEFVHCMAVTVLKGDRKDWEECPLFREVAPWADVRLLTVDAMLTTLMDRLETTPASSEVGRLLQVVKASGWLK